MPPHSPEVWEVVTTFRETHISDDDDHEEHNHQHHHRTIPLSEGKEQPTGRRRRFRSTVCFSDKPELHRIPKRSAYTERQKKQIWYREHEFERIREEFNKTLDRYQKGDEILEEDGHCMRGLEAKTKFGARRRKNNKKGGLSAVWETQIGFWKQRLEANSLDIANAYRPFSNNAKFRAIETGYNDQQYVDLHVRPEVKDYLGLEGAIRNGKPDDFAEKQDE